MSSPVLSSNDRVYILTQLTSAPDEVLVRAYLDLSAQHASILEARTAIAQAKTVVQTVTTVDLQTEPVDQPRRNLNPGVSSITKIGSNTKADILAAVADGRQPAAKFEEHCKLLWERGEIKFDGEEWWV